MGTSFSVSIVDAPRALDTEALQAEIAAALVHVDKLASTWREDSELTAFNAAHTADWVAVSPEFCAALSTTAEIWKETRGAFDITVGPIVNLWGFGPDAIVSEPPGDDAIADAMQSVGFDKMTLDCGKGLVRKDDPAMYIDLSGWAKGHAVDQLAAVLDGRGIDNYLVEIGGELRVKGHNKDKLDWAVGIEAPSTSRRVPHAVIRITDTSIATSGDYRNFFEHDGRRYSHTIDPRTGRPIQHHLAAVTVVHALNAYADAMATALLVLGPVDGPALANELDIAAYFLVRETTEIREITTPAFDKLVTS